MAVKFLNTPQMSAGADNPKTLEHLHGLVREGLALPPLAKIAVGMTETVISHGGITCRLPWASRR